MENHNIMEEIMKKKVLAILLVSAMGLSLAACGSSAGTSSAAAASTAASTASKAASTASKAASTASKAASTASKAASTASKTTSTASEAASGATLDTATVTIFIAASLDKAFEDEGGIISMYNKTQPNVKIEVNSGSSGTLEQQIEQGTPCDLFFSAGKKQMKAAKEAGFVVDGTQVNLLENKVVLIKRKGDTDCKVTGFDNMDQATSMALCADSVPAGQYARTIFDTIGTSVDALTAAGVTINECDKVTAALTAVSEGSNQIGIVYASDAANESGVEVIAEASNKELAENPLYPVALITNKAADAAETAAAEDFIKYLQSKEAMAKFQEYTFLAHDQNADSAASSAAS